MSKGRYRQSIMAVDLAWQIVELLNIVYCLAELLEFVAFVHLRIKAPHLRRPFRVPLPTWACVLMLTPATLLLGALIAQPILDMDIMVSMCLYSGEAALMADTSWHPHTFAACIPCQLALWHLLLPSLLLSL